MGFISFAAGAALGSWMGAVAGAMPDSITLAVSAIGFASAVFSLGAAIVGRSGHKNGALAVTGFCAMLIIASKAVSGT